MNYLGVDIGGTRIKWILLDKNAKILQKEEIATYSDDGESDWKARILEIIETQKTTTGGTQKEKLKVGISAPGLTDSANRKILHMPERLKGIENFDWSKAIDLDVSVINDGHSACLAEYHAKYQKKGIQNLLLLTLGTGVGGGAIINGELYQGNLNRAGHFGHISVDHDGAPTMTNTVGSLEYAIGNFSVRQRTHQKFESTKALVAAYQSGDVLAAHWWLDSVRKLAVGLGSLINAFSPERIVLGGGIAHGAKEALLGPLKEFMALYEWRPDGSKTKIEIAQYGQYAGAMGAALFAKSREK